MIPTPDEIARRYSMRPGCRFIAHEPVGITVFGMQLRVVLSERRPLSPIDEFLVRSIALGISTPDSMTAFLGLDSRTVLGRLAELRRDELIDLSSGSVDAPNCVLTSKGRNAANLIERTTVTEATIRSLLHGILRTPLARADTTLLKPKELRELGWREISAIPTKFPSAEEIDLASLDKVHARQWREKKRTDPSTIIAIRSVLKGVKTLYMPAVMMVYEVLGSSNQRQVGFVVDGILDEKTERVFAARGGVQKIVDLQSAPDKSTAELAAEYLSPVAVSTLGPLDEVDSIKARLDATEIAISQSESTLIATRQPDTRKELQEQVAIYKDEVEQLRAALTQQKAIRLATYDCAQYFDEALRTASTRIVVVSAFISSYVINNELLNKLDAALSRGVEIWIAYGLKDPNREQRPDWIEAETSLNHLRKRFKRTLHIKYLGNTHEKILICDAHYVITGSFNWLSFKGDRRRKVRREDALLVKAPSVIEEYFEEIVSRFNAPRAPSSD